MILKPRLPDLTRVLKTSILALFILLNILNLNTGWADNGDFNRISRWFSSGPAFLPENFPPMGTPQWQQRFFNYWVPYWKLDFPRSSEMFISALLLWLPGIVINRYLFSAAVLWVPLASLGARLGLLALLAWLLGWLERRPRPRLHILAFGLPLVLLFTTSDVAAYYNSFYQETGTLVFLPLVLGIILWGRRRRGDARFYAAYLAGMLLLTLSKSSCFYWAFLALPFVISFGQVRRRPLVYLPLAAGLVAIPLAAGLILTDVPNEGPNRPYNALFGGVLQLSAAPEQRLAELGLAQSAVCLGQDWYDLPGGKDCSRPYWDQINYTAVLRVMLAEPQIILRQVELLADSFQNLHLEMGKYALGEVFPRREERLNFWSNLKGSFFPRQANLLLAALALAGGIAWTWKKEGLAGDLARIGLLCLLAIGIDWFIQIWGDGQRDLLKHLFISNILFDLAALSVLNACLAAGLERLSKNKTTVPTDSPLARTGHYQKTP